MPQTINYSIKYQMMEKFALWLSTITYKLNNHYIWSKKIKHLFNDIIKKNYQNNAEKNHELLNWSNFLIYSWKKLFFTYVFHSQSNTR